MHNLITAFTYLVRHGVQSKIEPSELHLQNAFASVPPGSSHSERMHRLADTFAYGGNPTNPPDMLIKGGDAVVTAMFDRNSPVAILYSASAEQQLSVDDPSLSRAARTCETWDKRDLLYVFVSTDVTCFLYGDCFAASNTDEQNCSRRARVKNPHRLIAEWGGVELAAKVTASPLVAVLRQTKYDGFPESDRVAIQSTLGVQIYSINIPDPDNKSRTVAVILLTLSP